MGVKMSWYNGSAWKDTVRLSVYDGSWKEVLTCHVFDGSSWRMCYLGAKLNSFTIYNTGGDPVNGTFRADWTYDVGEIAGLQMRLQYSWDNSSWSDYNTYDPTINSTGNISIEGYSGYTSLDNTYFRLHFEVATGAQPAFDSPKSVSPTYPSI